MDDSKPTKFVKRVLFKCPICKETFTRKTTCDKHYNVCRVSVASRHIQNANVEDVEVECAELTATQLANMVKLLCQENAELKQRLKTLEDDHAIMKKWLRKEKKRINVTAWLTENFKPEKYSTAYFNRDQLEPVVNIHHLEVMFREGYVIGIANIIEHIMHKNNENDMFPVKAFTHKNNILYHYCDDKWDIMDDRTLGNIIFNIQRHLINLYQTKWEDANREFVDNDDNSDIIRKYLDILVCVNQRFTVNEAYTAIKQKLYNNIKLDLTHIWEYEFANTDDTN